MLFRSGVGFSLFFGQSFVVSQVLSANYADTYSAYDQGRWIDLVMLCRYYGYLMLVWPWCASSSC